MKAGKQLQLISSEPVLENRLGTEQFNKVPKKPGIYRFYDKRGSLLYVGKAKNLRSRLFSYKRARTGRVSSKVSRLIGQIHSFKLDITQTAQEALLLENQWIRKKRPPFNHANKQPETYYFVYLKPDDNVLEFRLAMKIHDDTDKAFWYGCFKGHEPVRRSMGCFLQLLWMAENRISDPHYLPVQLTRNLTPMFYRLPLVKISPTLLCDVYDLIRDWMLGRSCEILEWMAVQIECGKRLPVFHTRFMEDRIDHLKTFYDRKLLRHCRLRQLHSENNTQNIKQNELDDLLIKTSAVTSINAGANMAESKTIC